VRTASRRARRLGAFLLIVLSAWWVLLRRRTAVRWVEPPAGPAEPGGPGILPADVLATDAGLTELPELRPDPAGDGAASAAAVGEPAGTVAADEVVVAELLAGSPAGADVEERDFEEALAEAAPPAAPAESRAAESQAASAPAVPAPDEVVPPAAEPGPTEGIVADEPELGVDEPTMTIPRDAAGYDDETSAPIPMPTFSEAPTMEIPAVTDNLRAVRGIGPSMERMLHGLGIISFRQLAMLDGAELERVRTELREFRTRIERENWVGQARDLHKEKYGRDPA
jgi:predicted flap endonuclease-1-like 5' DNA nuclease